MSEAKLPRDNEELRQLFNDGLSNKQIAAMYGVCDAAVSRRRVLITGVSKKAPPPPPPPPEGTQKIKGRLVAAPDHRKVTKQIEIDTGKGYHIVVISLPRIPTIHGEFHG